MFEMVVDQRSKKNVPRTQDPAFMAHRVNRYFQSENRREVVFGRAVADPSIKLRTNDYLSLGHHPKILCAQARAILEHGNGLLMSGVYLDDSTAQRGFEIRLADFMGAEDCAISQSGYAANVGLIQAIADAATPVYVDMRAHMSLWEGARSAGAVARPFRHNDPGHLERLIKSHGAGVVVVDSIYSTTGSVCPLEAFATVCESRDCVLVVDESHALGTHGQRGEGLTVARGLEDKVHFRTASLAKAFAGRGGIVVGSAHNIEFFRFTALPAIFSTVIPPHDIAAFGEALEIIRNEGWRRHRLARNADYLRVRLGEIGYEVSASESQIIGLEAGPERRTIVLRDALEERGIFGAVFCAPATPRNRSMVRLSLNCTLEQDELDRVVEVCREIRDLVKPWEWPCARKSKHRATHEADKVCA